MSDGERNFNVRPGRIRSTRAPRQKSFLNQVLRAAQKVGHTSSYKASGKGASNRGRWSGLSSVSARSLRNDSIAAIRCASYSVFNSSMPAIAGRRK